MQITTGEQVMRRIIIGIVLLGMVAFVASLAVSQRGGEERGRGVLGELSKGQAVTVKDVSGRYEIHIFTNGPDMLGYKVLDVGPDYVVVEDIAQVTELRIPIYSIKAVSILRTGGRNFSQ
jgi:hypothetical protein